MYIERHSARNYRNIEAIELEPDKGINLIFGENGQGKTNLIESIWLFTGCQSFRTRRCGELVTEGKKEAVLETDFFAFGRSQSAGMTIDTKRSVTLNGVTQESPRNLLGEFQAIVFSPSTLAVVQDGPSEKRRFLDVAISLQKPNYACLLSRYLKAMAHRNALLKQLCEKDGDASMLDVWDAELARLGAKITVYRQTYMTTLLEKAAAVYEDVAGGRETMTIDYEQGIKSEDASERALATAMLAALEKNRRADIRRQVTSVGPHKDDLFIKVNALCARSYGSQGQQRSCALSLKLAEAALIRESSSEQPVALLDDVMSELDTHRQGYLLKHLEGWQVFITCCDPAVLGRLESGKAFEIENGNIKEHP